MFTGDKEHLEGFNANLRDALTTSIVNPSTSIHDLVKQARAQSSIYFTAEM